MIISKINYHGLKGRAMTAPYSGIHKSTSPGEILLIGGSHSSLERMTGVAEYLSRVGTITAIDWPGSGGMDSLYQLKKTADFDNLAAYLKWFIEKKYPKDQKINVVGMSLGFVLVTRMLQNYPEMIGRMNVVISFVGFVDQTDFHTKPWARRLILSSSWLCEHRPFAAIMRRAWCNRPILRIVYGHTGNEKFQDVDFEKTLDMEVTLWQINDIRTYARTIHDMFRLHDLRPVDMAVHHVAMRGDRYFDNTKVKKHLSQIFRDVHIMWSASQNHAPSVVANAGDAAAFIPAEMLAILQ
jgi:pimeloyl-ACP methyl ester carboxylesterase